MDDGVKVAPEPGIATLVSGIVGDGQRLIEQQIALFRKEIESALRQARNAAISLAIGAGVAAVGGLLLVIMAVHLLNAYTVLPLWGCYGLVGGVLAAAGVVLLIVGGKGASEVHILAPPQSTEAFKENVQWLKHQTNSEST